MASGKGVYAVATKDASGAAVMVWNYQHTDAQSVDVTLDLGMLPANLRGKRLRQRTFRIDDRVSNYWGDPATANLQQVSEVFLQSARTVRQTIRLTPNALQLITLEPDGGK